MKPWNFVSLVSTPITFNGLLLVFFEDPYKLLLKAENISLGSIKSHVLVYQFWDDAFAFSKNEVREFAIFVLRIHNFFFCSNILPQPAPLLRTSPNWLTWNEKFFPFFLLFSDNFLCWALHFHPRNLALNSNAVFCLLSNLLLFFNKKKTEN